MPRPRRGQPVGEIRPGTMKRFIKYLTDHYKGRLLVVLVCIILSAISMSFSNVFLQQLIDQVILPGMKVGMESVQAKFLRIIGTMGVFYLVGMATSAIYTQIMAGVTQGTLKNLRDEMFDAMEKLPIKYFDTHAHGDIMNTFTTFWPFIISSIKPSSLARDFCWRIMYTELSLPSFFVTRNIRRITAKTTSVSHRLYRSIMNTMVSTDRPV